MLPKLSASITWISLVLAVAPAAQADRPPGSRGDTVPRSVDPWIKEPAGRFEEPLVALGGDPSHEETRALEGALAAYDRRAEAADAGPLMDYLRAHPASPWKASLLGNLGVIYQQNGYFTRGLSALQEAWSLVREARGARARDVGDFILGHLADLRARLGQREELDSLLETVEGRPVVGSAATRLATARLIGKRMRRRPEVMFLCGPAALSGVLGDHPLFHELKATSCGTSLLDNWRWAKEVGGGLQMAHREPGGAIVAPMVLHWKRGHYSALLKTEGERCLLKDPLLGGERWISRAAIQEEGSGYALVPEGPLPEGWRLVGAREADGVTGGPNGWCAPEPPPGHTPEQPEEPSPCGGGGDGFGMPVYRFSVFEVGLKVVDIPLFYTPPLGLAIAARLTYNQKDLSQPQTFTTSNIGPKWTLSWLRSLTMAVGPTVVNGGGSGGTGGVIVLPDEVPQYPHPEGGVVALTGAKVGSSPANVWSAPETRTHLSWTYLDNHTLAIRHPDGKREVFWTSQDPGTGSNWPSRTFRLAKLIDRSGNALTFNYDASGRLSSVTDALGRATTLGYEWPGDALKVTKMTDPFGRVASFTYNDAGLLAGITDMGGLSSTFKYGGTGIHSNKTTFAYAADFLSSMTTPYGTTTFDAGDTDPHQEVEWYWIQATDPMGQKERVDYRGNAPGIGGSEIAPPGLNTYAAVKDSSYYFDKKVMAQFPMDYTKAKQYNWFFKDHEYSQPVLKGVKNPLESRIWFTYPGQPNADTVGTSSLPNQVMRVLDDGTVQTWAYEANPLGKLTKVTDPMGRVTVQEYSADGVDLMRVSNRTGGANETLAAYSYYPGGQLHTVTDAAGQTTTFDYTVTGQVKTVTNPKQETSTLGYVGGYLRTITGSDPASVTTLDYDEKDRVHIVTGPDKLPMSTDYDDLNRPTKRTFPDGSTEELLYDRLDLGRFKDRRGGWSVLTHNALRQLTELQDPMGRITGLDWCGCGSLEAIRDPMGHSTQWIRDLQGRVVAKRLNDGSGMDFTYDGTGRLVQRIDAQGQETNYQYYPDDKLRQVSYPNAKKTTPTVGYTYDSMYGRLATMTDAFGTTIFAYHPILNRPNPGAGFLATVDGPFANDTLSYTYDELGRLTGRSLPGSAETRVFDALGRLKNVTNPLGTFVYTYRDGSSLTDTLTLPNGQVTSYDYHPVAMGGGLKEIKHKRADGSVLSRFGYSYDPAGQISTWAQESEAAVPKIGTYGYDGANQLRSVILNGPNGEILRRFGYDYDSAGNRALETVDAASTTTAFNALNQAMGNQHATDSAAAPSRSAPKPAASRQRPGSPTESSPSMKR